VLDLCAAPGGKSTDAASSLREAFGDRFILVSNEVMGGRAGVLADNMALWGDPNVVVTCSDPKAFSKLSGFFDIIIADVPCSGEGMFRKDDEAVEDWSLDAVNFCAQRQRRILADVWPALREEGVLVYSTCTFEEAENDSNVEWVAEELGGTVVEGGLSGMEGIIPTRTGSLLVPGFVRGEGQFAAALVKTSHQNEFRNVKNARRTPAGEGGMVEKVRGGDLVVGIPEIIAGEVETLEMLRPIQTCVAMGTRKGKDFIPSADWALSLALGEGTYPSLDVDLATALKYLHRDAIAPGDAPKGFLTVRYEGYALGFVKNLGNRCNNLHPQGRRIRMDV
jgi:tRNA and rRNA cytosine-C5-methylases